MSGYTAYCDLPNGERIELPASMPDVEKTDGPLCDGKFELPETVKEMFKWMDETFGTWESEFHCFGSWMKLRKTSIRQSAGRFRRTNAAILPHLDGTPICIKQGRFTVWQEAHISTLPRTRAQRKMNSASTRSRSPMPGARLAAVTTWSASTTRKTMLLIQSIVLLWRKISSPAPQKRGCFLYGAGHPFRHGVL